MNRNTTAIVLAVTLTAALALHANPTGAGERTPVAPPTNATFDYQIGGDYSPPAGTTVVSRDWFIGAPLGGEGSYSICYVNAYQTQDDEEGVDRPDERSNWPPDLVLTELGDDPNWGGEYLVDISTSAKRRAAADHLEQMIATCATKGFDAVEYDNLDSWTRFDGTPVADDVPFGRRAAVAYAELITDTAHDLGLAVGQKNTPQLARRTSLRRIGFDFVIAEECGRYDECEDYTRVFGNHVIAVEYRRGDFRATCEAIGDQVSVVRRDRNVTLPGSPTYVFRSC